MTRLNVSTGLSQPSLHTKYSHFIMLVWGSIGMDYVKRGLCYKGTILQRRYRKMTISWSFSYISFVKFHGKEIWKPQNKSVIYKSML